MPVHYGEEFIRFWCSSLTAFPPPAWAGTGHSQSRACPPSPGQGWLRGNEGRHSGDSYGNRDGEKELARSRMGWEEVGWQKWPRGVGKSRTLSGTWLGTASRQGQKRSGRDVGRENTSSNQGTVLVVRALRNCTKNVRRGVKILVHKLLPSRKSSFRKIALQKNREGMTLLQAVMEPRQTFNWDFTCPTKFIYNYTGSSEQEKVITCKNNRLKRSCKTVLKAESIPEALGRPAELPRCAAGPAGAEGRRARLHFPPVTWRL